MPRAEGAIGVEFPDKTVFGDKDNVKFRYDATFMNEAAEGKLQAVGAVAGRAGAGGGTPCAQSIGSKRHVALGARPAAVPVAAARLCHRLEHIGSPKIRTTSCCRASPTWARRIYAYAFEADPRTGEYLLWSDTAASLTRLLIGLAISTAFALVVGIAHWLAARSRARCSGRSSPCCPWCRRSRSCRSCSSSWGSAKPRRSR